MEVGMAEYFQYLAVFVYWSDWGHSRRQAQPELAEQWVIYGDQTGAWLERNDNI